MIAHIRETDGKTQSVREHCRATAALCGSYADLSNVKALLSKIAQELSSIGTPVLSQENYTDVLLNTLTSFENLEDELEQLVQAFETWE